MRPARKTAIRAALWLVIPTTLPLTFLPGQAPGGSVHPSLLGIENPSKSEMVRRATPLAAAVAACREAVVHPFVWVERAANPFKVTRPSTGIILDTSGTVLTYWDLIREAVGKGGEPVAGHVLKVKLHSGRECPAKFLAHDAKTGLALLRIDAGSDRLTVCPLGQAKHRRVGAPNVVLSYHDGKDQIAFGGVLLRSSGDARLRGATLDRDRFFLTDAAIRRTAHGAAVLGVGGVMLGICDASAIAPEVEDPSLAKMRAPSYGVVIPAETVRRVFAKQLEGAVSAAASSAAEAAETPTARVLAKVGGSIVGVWGGEGAPPASSGDLDPYATRRRERLGSGVVIDPSGLVLTNHHLVQGRAGVSVIAAERNGTRRVYQASVLGSDRRSNTALLDLKLGSGRSLPAIELGDSEHVMRGETVLGVGNPYGAALTVSAGVISAIRSGGRIQADPNLGNQNGGGAVVDLSGRLIGIVDQGRIDRLAFVFAESKAKKEAVKLETNLTDFYGINAIRRAHRDTLDEHAGDRRDLHTVPAISSSARAIRTTAIVETIRRVGSGLLNVYVNISSKKVDVEDNPFAVAMPVVITRGLGSGFIITTDGLALTNWHVVDSAVFPSGEMRQDRSVHVGVLGKRYEVDVLSTSREDDLALLRLKLKPGETVTPIAFGDSDALELGETVIAVGNPHGKPDTVTVGVVTAKDQSIHIRNRFARFHGLIKTDAAINGGNSGGALLDISGRLVGVNSAGGGGRNVTGYAIPVNYVRDKLNNVLLSWRKLRCLYPGISLGDKGGYPTVATLDRFGPAARAGLEVGDALLSLDGVALRWSLGLKLRLLSRDAARPLKFRILRDGKKSDAEVQPWTTEGWSVHKQIGCETELVVFRDEGALLKRAGIALHRGFTKNAKATPSRIEASAVRITRLHPGAAADAGHLRPGDLLLGCELTFPTPAGESRRLVQWKTVREMRDFFNRRSTYEGAEFRCWIYRGGAAKLVTVTAKRQML
jgi:S1-C subfamily serine protease